jgi:hypothetical protein
MKYDFREMPSAEIRRLLCQDIDGPNIFTTEEIMEAMTVLTNGTQRKCQKLTYKKAGRNFLCITNRICKKGGRLTPLVFC